MTSRKKVGHVSFSAEAARRPRSAVTVREEHGVYVDPLGRTVTAAVGEEAGVGRQGPSSSEAATSSGSGAATAFGDGGAEYDNLVVSLGMLKCGFRYESVIPVYGGRIASVGTSVDPDLTAEAAQSSAIEEEGEDVEGDATANDDGADGANLTGDGGRREQRSTSHNGGRRRGAGGPQNHEPEEEDHLRIRLAARRPGRYRGRLALELAPPGGSSSSSAFPAAAEASTPTTAASPDAAARQRESLDIGGEQAWAMAAEAVVGRPTPPRRLTSVQVEATLMGKDQGKPQLKDDVRCVGKLIGYDSDEETEWRGFDDP